MTYDDQHQETGSSNISKATPEWHEKLVLARAQAMPGEHPLHLAYDLISEEVEAGVPWNKCQNCGSPYKLETDGASSTHCSVACFDAAVADLNSYNRSAYDYSDDD